MAKEVDVYLLQKSTLDTNLDVDIEVDDIDYKVVILYPNLSNDVEEDGDIEVTAMVVNDNVEDDFVLLNESTIQGDLVFHIDIPDKSGELPGLMLCDTIKGYFEKTDITFNTTTISTELGVVDQDGQADNDSLYRFTLTIPYVAF